MNEFPDIFGGDLTTEFFCYSSIAFVLLYAAGFLYLQRWSRTFGETPAIRRHIISGLGVAFAAAGVGLGLHAANITLASAGGQSETATSISPLELHRSVATKSLPVGKFEDQTVVFPNRD
jgi:hypothetical protein